MEPYLKEKNEQKNKKNGTVPLAKFARLLPGVADREKLVAVQTVKFPLAWNEKLVSFFINVEKFR